MSRIQTLASVRQQLIRKFGTDGVHMLEHGATAGVILGLWFTFSPAAVVLLIAISATPARAGPIAVIAEVIDLIDGEQARIQESYLAGAFVGGGITGAVGGAVLRVGARWSGVDIPTAADVLAALA